MLDQVSLNITIIKFPCALFLPHQCQEDTTAPGLSTGHKGYFGSASAAAVRAEDLTRAVSQLGGDDRDDRLGLVYDHRSSLSDSYRLVHHDWCRGRGAEVRGSDMVTVRRNALSYITLCVGMDDEASVLLWLCPRSHRG